MCAIFPTRLILPDLLIPINKLTNYMKVNSFKEAISRSATQEFLNIL
jgi:hypothetical protein